MQQAAYEAAVAVDRGHQLDRGAVDEFLEELCQHRRVLINVDGGGWRAAASGAPDRAGFRPATARRPPHPAAAMTTDDGGAMQAYLRGVPTR